MAKKAKRVWVIESTDPDLKGWYVETGESDYNDDTSKVRRFATKRAALMECLNDEQVIRAEVYIEMRPVECLREVA